MKHKLIIGQKKVELETELVYQGIELKYNGDLYINNLLPDDYIVTKGNKKIIIVRFNKRDEILKNLFEYDGYCNIYYGYLVDKDLKKHELIISKPNIVTWNSMNKKTLSDGTTKKSLWESLTTDYELMVNTYRNDYIEVFKTAMTANNKENRKIETKTRIKLISKRKKRDKNLSSIEKLQKAIGEESKPITKTKKRVRSTY